MPLPSISAIVVAAAALLVHAALCLFTERRPLAIGFINIVLAGVIVYMSLSMRAGQLVVATEFGAVLMRGLTTTWLFRIALVCVGLIPGIAWHKIRKLNKEWKSPWVVTVLTGLAVGCWAASRVMLVNPNDPQALQIYGYDVCWPPLVVWLVVCFTGSVLALIEAEPIMVQIMMTGALLTPFASFALHFQDLPDPWGTTTGWQTYAESRAWWLVIERLVFAVTLVATADRITKGESRRRKGIAMVLAATIGIGFALLPDGLRWQLGLLPAVLLLGLLAALFVDELRSPATTAPATPESTEVIGNVSPALPPPRPPNWKQVRDQMEKALPIGRVRAVAISLSLPVMAACLIDFFLCGHLNRTFEVVVLLAFWLVFTERLAFNSLDILGSLIQDGKIRLPLRAPAKKAKDAVWTVLKSSSGAVKNYFGEGTTWMKTVKAVAAPLAVIFLVTVGNEFLNYKKTIIRPFQWAVKENKDDISNQVTAKLINALGRLRSTLSTELIDVERRPSGERQSSVRFMTAISENVDATIVKGDDLSVGGVKIPLNTFLGPLQTLVRGFLGIRTISGSVDETRDGQRYVINANASDGASWREATDPIPDLKAATASGGPKPAANAPPTTSQPASGGQLLCDLDNSDLHDAIDNAVERLAFDISSSDPSYQAAGLTDNWEAFKQFRSGLSAWRCYDSRRDGEDLESAITSFRKAVNLDQHFALAYFRLGTALRERSEPGAAVDAFRTSIAVNPSFVRGALVTAATLYNYQSFYQWRPAIAPLQEMAPDKREEALKIWTSVVDLPANTVSLVDRLSAVAGICQSTYDSITAADTPKGGKVYYVPYFYCSMAAQLADRIPHIDQGSQERQQEAAAIDRIGVSLEAHKSVIRPLDPKAVTWFCFSDLDEPNLESDGSLSDLNLAGSQLTASALAYYRKSLALIPGDTTVRCNEATAELYLTGRTQELDQLGQDPIMHADLAFALAENGSRVAHRTGPPNDDTLRLVSGYYRRAQEEFERAVKRDQRLFDALTGYAFAMWEWDLLKIDGRAREGPSREAELEAERAARDAVRLETNGQSDKLWLATQALAETLLAQGRFQEAEQTLRQIDMTKAKDRRWPNLNETRWDLSEALLCQDGSKGPAEVRTKSLDAIALYDSIRANEEAMEQRPFSWPPESMHPVLRQQACPPAPDAPSDVSWQYTMVAPRYTPGPVCAWSAVSAQVRGQEDTGNGLELRVWGRGTDGIIPISNKRSQSIALNDLQATAKGYYFAQLLDMDKNPVSAVKSFETFPTPKSGTCSKNMITLQFEPANLIDKKNSGAY